MGSKGIVASTAALALLLQEGIGDTIRVSLTDHPREEVRVGFEILDRATTRGRQRRRFELLGELRQFLQGADYRGRSEDRQALWHDRRRLQDEPAGPGSGHGRDADQHR